MKKRKMFIVALAMTLMSTVGATGVLAGSKTAAPKAAERPVCQSECTNFVDADGDDICDNRVEKERPNYVDKDQDGVCDNQTKKSKKNKKARLNYVDKNQDGVCDNQGKKNCGKGKSRKKSK